MRTFPVISAREILCAEYILKKTYEKYTFYFNVYPAHDIHDLSYIALKHDLFICETCIRAVEIFLGRGRNKKLWLNGS